jgi:Ca2+-binding RTX toxin-like protein
VWAYAGGDTVWGRSGLDTVYAGPGNDTVYGGADTDYLFGDDGADILDDTAVSSDFDVLCGYLGDDTLKVLDSDPKDVAVGATGSNHYTYDSGAWAQDSGACPP